MNSISIVHKYLKKLSLSEDEVLVYKFLLSKGYLTVLQLSRDTHIERTKLYRIVEDMQARGLLVEKVDYNKRMIGVSGIEALRKIVEKKVDDYSFLTQNLSAFEKAFEDSNASLSPTKVKYYRGKEGIKQVLWNELKARKCVRTFSYRILDEVVGRKFFKSWSMEMDVRDIEVRDLRSFQFLKSEAEVKGRNIMPFRNDNIRYVSPEIIDFEIEMDIYNDTVVIFNWHKGDVYAVEIEDSKFASMQKKIFDMYWGIAKPVTVSDWLDMMKRFRSFK